eukprot:CAMPEP_0172052650 /NCGR_PEP_ID=MMETSP1043-20130122/3774_1 /TAXON_ID=464988 /ORGANISM="Hemiselmis andersenii, Strain CCMP441" /LENGTH=190 /DNA_ID=CAMNT_0012711823 /DNA_START=57 /DNA_END=626 /DNA_ORIENTATION=+
MVSHHHLECEPRVVAAELPHKRPRLPQQQQVYDGSISEKLNVHISPGLAGGLHSVLYEPVRLQFPPIHVDVYNVQFGVRCFRVLYRRRVISCQKDPAHLVQLANFLRYLHIISYGATEGAIRREVGVPARVTMPYVHPHEAPPQPNSVLHSPYLVHKVSSRMHQKCQQFCTPPDQPPAPEVIQRIVGSVG